MIIVPPSTVQQAVMVPCYPKAGIQQAYLMPAPADMEQALIQSQP